MTENTRRITASSARLISLDLDKRRIKHSMHGCINPTILEQRAQSRGNLNKVKSALRVRTYICLLDGRALNGNA